jgi:PfaD family protein
VDFAPKDAAVMTTQAGQTAPLSSGGSVRAVGYWQNSGTLPVSSDPVAARQIVTFLRQPVFVVRTPHGDGVANTGVATWGGPNPGQGTHPLIAILPACPLESLGDTGFCRAHGLRYAYMTGAMANGIASADIVEAMCKAGMLGSFGAAGLSLGRITEAVDRLQASLAGRPFAVNLIHSPNEPAHEMAVSDLLIKRGVPLVEASAYLDLTPAIVRYRVAGLRLGSDGRVVADHRIIAKVSRVEVATRFLSPPPTRIVQELLAQGLIDAQQAELATKVPMCDDLTAEADSGGHTDNRPAITLLPTMLALRDRLQRQYQYPEPVRVGLAGGIATPAGAAAAFAMGAAYIVTGSVNQSCVESGSSDPVRRMLAECGQADVTMAPAADMFEMGVKVQVLKRGTMFAMRAAKLFELYRNHASWEAIHQAERVQLEKTLFRRSFEEIWTETEEFFAKRDPTQLPKAKQDPKHKMALVFRWYLGLSSRWANAGDPTRTLDYQVWCGPSMGAFNEWVKGTPLEAPAERTVVTVARNLLYGAALHLRKDNAIRQGARLNPDWFPTGPWTAEELDRLT